MNNIDEFATWDCPNCQAAVWIGRRECWRCNTLRPETKESPTTDPRDEAVQIVRKASPGLTRLGAIAAVRALREAGWRSPDETAELFTIVRAAREYQRTGDDLEKYDLFAEVEIFNNKQED